MDEDERFEFENESMNTGGCLEFTREEWTRRLQDEESSVPTELVDRFIMDYLVIEGYKDAAYQFAQESGVQSSIDLETISDRVEIRQAVIDGDFEKAISMVNTLEPKLLEDNPELLWALRRQ
ncbi:unnamed protein product, partial [Heterosigma akashiwo]